MPDLALNPLRRGRHKRMYVINQHNKGGIIPVPEILEVLMAGNANDTSGNGNNGTVNGAVLSNGKDGLPNTSYGFGGTFGTSTADYIDYGNGSPLNDIHANDFSLSCWVYDAWNSVTNIGTIWSSWSSGGKGVLIRTNGIMGDTNRSLRVDAYFGTTNMQFLTDRLFANSTWVNIVVVFDSATKTAKIYFDGVEATYATTIAGSGTVTSDSANSKISGKLAPTNTLQTWNGYKSLLRIYNRKISLTEISALANE